MGPPLSPRAQEILAEPEREAAALAGTPAPSAEAAPLEGFDLHHHLLPGIDDGPPTLDGSVALARRR